MLLRVLRTTLTTGGWWVHPGSVCLVGWWNVAGGATAFSMTSETLAVFWLFFSCGLLSCGACERFPDGLTDCFAFFGVFGQVPAAFANDGDSGSGLPLWARHWAFPPPGRLFPLTQVRRRVLKSNLFSLHYPSATPFRLPILGLARRAAAPSVWCGLTTTVLRRLVLAELARWRLVMGRVRFAKQAGSRRAYVPTATA